MRITVDDSDFQNRIRELLDKALSAKDKAVRNIASEILRLSQFEVPHDVGTLQNSGFIKDGFEESVVGYNTEYAARLHEHPEYRFQKGRKGKYLEDPIKNNMFRFLQYYKDLIS